jgi:hypothetical protein
MNAAIQQRVELFVREILGLVAQPSAIGRQTELPPDDLGL